MFIFPMAGLSDRFRKAGFLKPKYMLELHGRSVFSHAVWGFRAFFKSEKFLFIARDIQCTPDFIKNESKKLGIENFDLVVLERETIGQAETVALGLKYALKEFFEPLTIFNIDSFHKSFNYPTHVKEPDSYGYLEVFQGEGDNWSYIKPKPCTHNEVSETAEKRPISNLCSTGLYHFTSAYTFLDTFEIFKITQLTTGMPQNELFIAPMYNILISRGLKVRYHEIKRSDIVFCGTPAEYKFLLSELSLWG